MAKEDTAARIAVIAEFDLWKKGIPDAASAMTGLAFFIYTLTH